jgi:hypothetical protein
LKRLAKSLRLRLPPLKIRLPRKLRRSKRRRKYSQFSLPRFKLPLSRRKLRRLKRSLKLPTFKVKVSSLKKLNPFQQVSYSQEEQTNSLFLLSWLGYVLLFGSALDYLIILYPLQLTNPSWELQTFTQMVNNAWALLLAVLLIFLPKRASITRLELQFLSLLRWGLFLGGALFILLIPLGILNTQRIQESRVAELNRQQTVRTEELNNLQRALESGQLSPIQLRRIATAFNLQATPNETPLRQRLLEKVQEQRQQLRQNIATQKSSRSRQLFGQAVRVNSQALFIGIFLLRSWWEVRWLKKIQKRAQRSARKKRAQGSSGQTQPEESQLDQQQVDETSETPNNLY